MNNKPLLSIRSMERILETSRPTVYKHIRSGKLPKMKKLPKDFHSSGMQTSAWTPRDVSLYIGSTAATEKITADTWRDASLESIATLRTAGDTECTLRTLSSLLSLTESTVSRILRGDRQAPAPFVLIPKLKNSSANGHHRYSLDAIEAYITAEHDARIQAAENKKKRCLSILSLETNRCEAWQ